MRSSIRVRRLYLIAVTGITFAVTPPALRADETNTNLAVISEEKHASIVELNDVVPAEIVPVVDGPTEDVSVEAEPADSAPVMKIVQANESTEPAPGATEEQDPASADITSPYVFRKGLRERDLSIGFGKKINVDRFHGRTEVDMIQVLPRWGRFRNSTQEILWEVPLTVFTEPDTSFLGGVTLMFRQHLTKNRRFSPFIEFGPGLTVTDLKIHELGGSFQFSLQGGAGIRAAISEHSDLVIGARWFHLSNAGLRGTNTGLNNYLITAGYSRLY